MVNLSPRINRDCLVVARLTLAARCATAPDARPPDGCRVIRIPDAAVCPGAGLVRVDYRPWQRPFLSPANRLPATARRELHRMTQVASTSDCRSTAPGARPSSAPRNAICELLAARMPSRSPRVLESRHQCEM